MNNYAVTIDSPVKGEWAIFNPPGHPKLAFDFLAVDKKKSPYKTGGIAKHLISFIHVEDTHAWSKPVLSPVEGVVVESYDGITDRVRINMVYDLFRLLLNKPKKKEGFGAFGGNYVVIKFDNYFLLVCHLKQGSITLKLGDKVKKGDAIGKVGNSGSSIQPHLHIQVMENKNIFPLFGNLLPFKVSEGKYKNDNVWEEIKNFKLSNGEHYLL